MVLVVEVGGKGRVGRVNGDGEFWLSLDCKRVKNSEHRKSWL